ncbi:MAG TPA: lipase family protein [Sporichthya sp.]|nr:lipase family protein [Sporichthya sp.]
MTAEAKLQAGRSWARRTQVLMAAAVAAATLATVPVLTAAGTADAAATDDGSGFPAHPATDPFYIAPVTLTGVAPGTILRSRPVTIRGMGFPVPVRAWQVLYRSTDAQGRPNAVSGTVGVLDDGRPLVGRPLVAYNVGSHGLGPDCAPSYLLRQGADAEEPIMAGALARGWAVMVSDYEGSGTPGPHTYGSGLATGRAVLDGARAAQRLPALGLTARSPVALWGYSEGGLATAWAAELAPKYAPELNIVGAAAGGVPASLGNVARKIDGGPLSGFVLAAAVGLDRAYPTMRLHELLNSSGQIAAEAVATMCQYEWTMAFANKHMADFTTVPDPLNLPRVRAILDANTLGARNPGIPLYLYESAQDEFMPLADVRGLVRTYCGYQLPVSYYEDSFSEHISLAGQGAPAAIAWLGDRFAGTAAPSSC